jgi:hypothetical protein
MTNEVIRLRRPVMRGAIDAGCAGWTPIIRTPAEPAPAVVPSVNEPATPDSRDEVKQLPTIDSPRR